MSERLRYKAVLFDWHGTLNDMNVLRAQDKYVGQVVFGLELTDNDIEQAWGNPPEVFLPMLFGKGGDTRPWQEMHRIFVSYDPLFPRRLRPDALEALNVLGQVGVTMGVVTSDLRERVLRGIQQAGLSTDRFQVLHTRAEIGDDIEAGRPILGKALGELALLGVSPSEVLFVGDETATMRDAEAVGIDYAVVLGGTFSRQRILEGGVPPRRIIEDLHQLPGILGIEFPKN